ncbi:putative disease resistance protein; 44362-46367 [Arabidopsis thaliana]|nr:putative disease resistance protein; 44362-46367 [Arabidopsis thaliana]
MEMIEFLDISHNSFHGKLPRSFLKGCDSLIVLKLSHKKLSEEVFPEASNFFSILELSMDNNLFTGKIGRGLQSLRSLIMLDISNNNLSGVIPSWFDQLQDLHSLQISNNLLEGEVPISLFNMSSLQLLALSANSLSGDLPQAISGYGALKVLLLRDNNLSGVIPDTLLGKNIIVLDLRNNRLSGNIPEFINTQYIRILLLRGNNLTGSIPRRLCAVRSIHLLDLANNKLNGSIPSCLRNASLDGFAIDYELSTQTKIEFATKHRYDAYRGGNLKLLFGLDLSKNELSGVIPQGKQFNSFDMRSYIGNPLLCGQPTDIRCIGNTFQEADYGVEAVENTIDMVSFYWSFVAAYITILLGLLASLSFDSPWSRVWFYIVDALVHKLVTVDYRDFLRRQNDANKRRRYRSTSVSDFQE